MIHKHQTRETSNPKSAQQESEAAVMRAQVDPEP